MLSDDERNALCEIEQRLLASSPTLVRVFHGVTPRPPYDRSVRVRLRVLVLAVTFGMFALRGPRVSTTPRSPSGRVHRRHVQHGRCLHATVWPSAVPIPRARFRSIPTPSGSSIRRPRPVLCSYRGRPARCRHRTEWRTRKSNASRRFGRLYESRRCSEEPSTRGREVNSSIGSKPVVTGYR